LAPPIVRLTGEELTEYASAWKTTIGEKVFGRGRDMIITKEDCIKHINTHKTIYYCDNKPADSEIITRDTARKIIAENPDDLLLLTDQYESGHTIAIYCKRTLEEKRSYIWSMTLYES